MSSLRQLRFAWLAAAALLAHACTDATGPGSDPGPVVKPTIGAVRLLPEARSFRVGDTVTFVARPLTADGRPIDGVSFTWRSSDTSVIAITAAGHATAKRTGTTMIRATTGGSYHEAEVIVQLAPVATVELSATTLSIVEFESRTIAVTARDSAGRALLARPATWISENPSIATIDAVGRVTGHAVGTANVRVEVEGKSAVASVTVGLAPVGEITVSPTPLVLSVGQLTQLTAVVRDAAGNVLPGRQVTWVGEQPSVALVGADGRVYGTAPGYATVLATSGGKTVGIGATVTNGEPDAMTADLIVHRTSTGVLGEIFIVSTSAASAAVKLNAGNVSRQAAPSPDGSRIAFYVSQEDLTTGGRMDDIFAVDRDGMNMKRLTSEAGYDGDPAWSPDGARIAWRHIDEATGRSSIWVMNADGSAKVNLTGDMVATHSLGNPAWSPDGTRIAFDGIQVGTAHTGIWSMAADGSDKRRHTGSTSGFDNGPTWSPDGRRIAFTRAFDNERDIAIVTLATEAIERIRLPFAQWSPAWSPSGEHLAFWQDIGVSGSSAVYTVRADGTNLRIHTPVAAGVHFYDPQWIRR